MQGILLMTECAAFGIEALQFVKLAHRAYQPMQANIFKENKLQISRDHTYCEMK